MTAVKLQRRGEGAKRMPLSLETLPDELLLAISNYLANNPLGCCSRGFQNLLPIHVDAKWRLYDPERVHALWKSFRPLRTESEYDLVLLPFEIYCEKHGCLLDADGTPSSLTLDSTDCVEAILDQHFAPLDSPGLRSDEVDELWYLQRNLIPPSSRYNYPACWRCGSLVCEHT